MHCRTCCSAFLDSFFVLTIGQKQIENKDFVAPAQRGLGSGSLGCLPTLSSPAPRPPHPICHSPPTKRQPVGSQACPRGLDTRKYVMPVRKRHGQARRAMRWDVMGDGSCV